MIPVLEVRGLTKDFYLHEQKRLVNSCHKVSFSLPYGGFVGIVGRSGSGKSTILRCIYRTYLPQEGSAVYQSAAYGAIDLTRATERQIIALRRREIGYVSQFLKVLPRTTAREHVEQALMEVHADPRTATRRAEEMLEYFQLPRALWDLYPNTFSGGESLRLNLARAMVKQPRLLLLDEPTASLDNASKELVRCLLLQMKEQKTSMLGIFHDLEFMEGVCDEVFNLSQGHLDRTSSIA